METMCLFLFLLSFYPTASNSVNLRNIHYASSGGPYFDQFSTTPIADYEDANAKSIRSEIFQRIIEGKGYDAKIRPPSVNGSGPTEVRIGIYLRSIENVDDIHMQYSVQMTFYQEWNDPRLDYSDIQNNIPHLQLIVTGRIWMPDLFFRNEKSGHLHELLVPNLYTRVFPNGLVLQSFRISLVLSCNMNLRAYPLDIQTCPIGISSYGWTTKDLVLDWKNKDSFTQARDFSTPRFTIKGSQPSYCNVTTPTGTYGCLVLKIIFAREFGFYLIQIYLPCSMLVVVSWVSFWLEPTAVEARVSLGVTTILTIVTQTYGINQSAPPASYAKALDVWTAWCQVMVFGALLEFACVNYLCNVRVIRAKKELSGRQIDKEVIQNEEERLLSEALARAKQVDRSSRIIFPMIFVIFNIFYWCHYLIYHNRDGDDIPNPHNNM